MVSKKKIDPPVWLYMLGAFFSSFLTICIGMIIIYSSLYQYQSKIEINKQVNSSEINTGQSTQIIKSELKRLKDDLRILSSFIEMTPQANDEILKELFYNFAENKINYDQIRFLDFQGIEKVRIDRNRSGIVQIVEPSQLQNKSDRYYFKESIILSKDKIYRSPLDLNMENGKIEIPRKPMLRIATPVFRDNQKAGIAIINFKAKALFVNLIHKKLPHETEEVEHYILNGQGYWLHHHNTEKEYTFMFPEKEEDSFKVDFPTEWNKIQKGNEVVFETKKGIFIYNTIEEKNIYSDLSPSAQKLSETEKWYYLTLIPEQLIQKIKKSKRDYYLRASPFFLIPSFILSAIIAILFTLYKKQLKQLKINASLDSLTESFNLRTGLSSLNSAMIRSEKLKEPLFIAFLDINDLKKVNDNFGHIEGDHLIKQMAEIIKGSLRDSDFLTRVGGDEFLMVLLNCNEQTGLRVMTRIKDHFMKANQLKNHSYQLAASIGHIMYDQKTYGMNAKQLIKEADKNMYKEKKEKKSETN